MTKKFNNFTELLITKERYKYNLKKQEENLVHGFEDFRYNLIDSARASVMKFGIKSAATLVVKFFQNRYSKKRNASK